ncbi:ABC transporter permease [Propionibacteriaceae bacterium Y1685]|uniref:ABC transporter permease n=1 Tax=Microlunatus sp. Y1700 TaxID=3418487 RepID=UPI003B7B285B
MIKLITAELIKLQSTKLWLYGWLAALVLGGGLVGMIGLIGPENSTPPMPGLNDPRGVATVLGLVGFTVFVPALMGAVAMTGEFRHRTITPTFLAEPRRWRVLVAKLIIWGLYGLSYGIITCGSAIGALYASAALTSTGVGMPFGEVASMMARVAVAMAAYCLIGVAIGAIVRHQLLAVGIVLGWFYFLEYLIMIIPGASLLYPYLPGGATAALTRATFIAEAAGDQLGMAVAPLVSPLAGGLLLVGYALVSAAAAVTFPLRRDV